MRLKHAHHKAKAWGNEFIEVFRGTAINAWLREPPSHYLDYTLDHKVPVILIPGILNRWGSMKKLGNNVFSIPDSAKLLGKVVSTLLAGTSALHQVQKSAEAVRKLIDEKGIKGVVLVAHSKGGLIGKYLLTHHNHDRRVLGLVAVATPFSGSGLAKLFPHQAFQELKRDSGILKDLQGHPEINKQIISVYPEYDTHVWAPQGSYLEGAENIELPVHGHSVLGTKEVQEEVIHAVEKLTQTAL